MANILSLIHLKGEHVAGFKAINKDYLVWEESSSADWLDTRLHIYNFKTHKDQIFYTYTVDPTTGNIYSMNSSECVILNGSIYFDDIVGVNSNVLQINLYAYEISSGKISLIKRQVQDPFVYHGALGWFECDDNTQKPVLVLNSNHSITKKYTVDGASIFHFSDNVIAISDTLTMPDTQRLFSEPGTASSHFSEKEKKTANAEGHSILTGTSVTPLLVLKGFGMGQESTNGKVTIWDFDDEYKGFPMFYDIHSQRFVLMDSLPKGRYSCAVNQNELLFIHKSKDSMKRELYLLPVS